jgi:hypothetical protein
MKTFLSLLSLCIIQNNFAQSDSAKKITYCAYGEMYYSYDFGKPAGHEKPNFLYNHKRHNEVNANLLLLKANFIDKNYRATLGLMAGNYVTYNLSSEPTWAQNIYEANIGVKLSKQKNIWVDVGIMPSHIGFESAVSVDCWTLTRSLAAENSPYYETGIKFSYTSKNEKLFLAAMYLNGWQKIQKPKDIQNPSFGMQATYKPSKKLTLNYSNFLGTDKADIYKSFRHFHNFYLQYEPTEKFGIIAGLDVGVENTIFNNYTAWYTPVLIAKKTISKKTSMAFRAEYYSDKNETIVSTGTANGFQTFGYSTNLDYAITDKVKWRFEGKLYNAKDKIFANNTSNNNVSFSTNLTIKL